MFEPTIIISFLSLLMLAGGVFLFSRRFSTIPYTVLLVFVGILVAGVVKLLPELGFLTAFQLTPELLFFVFLPALIFEAAYNVKLKSFYQSFFSITSLATVGLIVSALFVGFGSYFILGLVGIEVPLMPLLLFGAIISATDPIAVLSLFKSLGAPKRLALMFEGESLFNDATAVALFLSFLIVIETTGASAVVGQAMSDSVSFGPMATATLLFVSMIGLGVLFGVLVGKLFSWLIQVSKKNEMATLTFMLVMAHITFLLTEMANEAFLAKGWLLGISPIIATTVASLELGNDGALTLSPKIKSFVNRFWEQLAFFSNSLVFLLVGVLVIKQNIFSVELILPTVIGILLVFVGRAISVYVSFGFVEFFRLDEKVPFSWKVLLSWASIRGALSIIMVLTLPADLSIAGWALEASPRDFILAMTLGAVLASLLGKTLTIPFVIKKLKILDLDPAEKVILSETRRFVNILKKEKLDDSYRKGYVPEYTYQKLSADLMSRLESCPLGDSHIFTEVISHYALGVEKYYLELLYSRGEIDSQLFVRIYNKIACQESELDSDSLLCDNSLSNKLIWSFAKKTEARSEKSLPVLSVEQRFLYYRALSIIARKVIKDLNHKNFPVHYKQDINPIMSKYQQYYDRNQVKMSELLETNADKIKPILDAMGEKMLADYEGQILDELVATHFTTDRVRARFRS